MENQIPRYAILSHTWGKEEVTYEDITTPGAERKAGYQKIKGCGERAMEDGWDYFWVDTCCIDKRSSAELSEAINSMFRWYKNAKICYVYLSDVSVASPPHVVYPTVSTLEDSRWFRRGWTLQELIAPSRIEFFDKDWQEIGTKETLIGYLKKITTIDMEALVGADLSTFSVARRMSWAAKRKTTRTEDIAYSLMGIFNINMPLLYGEGGKSFTRLQEEIMRNSDDQSIFAWRHDRTTLQSSRGLLACSPNEFADSRNVSPLGILGRSGPFTVTNIGLQVSLFLIPFLEKAGIYRACLDCLIDAFPYSPAIYLQKTVTMDNVSQYIRIKSDTLDKVASSEKMRGEYARVYVRSQDLQLRHQSTELTLMKIVFSVETTTNWKVGQAFPAEHWDHQTRIFQSSPTAEGKVGALLFTTPYTWDKKKYLRPSTDIIQFVLLFGISAHGAWCHISQPSSMRLDQIYESYSYTPAPWREDHTTSTCNNFFAKIAERYVYNFRIFHISVGDKEWFEPRT